MKTLFFYTVKIPKASEKDKEQEFYEAKCSLNLNKVIRSISNEDGSMVVILDDFHQDMVTTPISVNPNTNKVIKNKKEMATLQSEIVLSKEDGERFFKLLNIE
jgi:hypothetical protein